MARQDDDDDNYEYDSETKNSHLVLWPKKNLLLPTFIEGSEMCLQM